METIERLQEVEERLADVVRGPGKDAVIIGGHYPINPKGEAETYSDGAFGFFPEYTFGLASKLVAQAKGNGRNAKIALVVDDHSLMSPNFWYQRIESETKRGQTIAKLVKGYFDNFSLPDN